MTDAPDTPKPVEEKQPESDLSLRPERIAVTRLSRKALIAVGGGISIILGSALIFALQSEEGGDAPEELFATDQRPNVDTLASLPTDYSAIPQLGPPLPGDLGGPIVDAGVQYDLPPPAAAAAPPVDPAIEERRRRKEAALTSPLFGENRRQGDAATVLEAPAPLPVTRAGLPAAPVSNESNARLIFASSPYILQSGSIISAALVTGIKSNVEGQIAAQVTSHVYDSPTGRTLLIPQGSRLIGSYANNVSFGQDRLALVWNRLILPNGKSLNLDALPGSDVQGFAGLTDGVDRHLDRLAVAAGLSTILSIGAQAGSAGDSDIAEAIRDGITDTAGRTGNEIVQRQLNVPPTITIRPGFPMRVLVGQDLILEPYERHGGDNG